MSKRALITGITGQDGSYLAELLLDKGYHVCRRGPALQRAEPLARIEHLLDRVELQPADLLDQLSLIRLIEAAQPDEVYNLAAQSFVPTSWNQPMLTGEFNAQGVTRVLEAIRRVNPAIRFYQASSSEMFGKVREVPQTELTPFYPRSPYGVVEGLRPLHHGELPGELRPVRRVGHPLQSRVAPPRAGVRDAQDHRRGGAHQAGTRRFGLRLGNLDAQRDWGFAGDYVRAMWLMLQQDGPGRLRDCHRREPLGEGAGRGGVQPRRARLAAARRDRSRSSSVPAEVDHLMGDSSKARSSLGWQPEVDFPSLIKMMVDADLERLSTARPVAAPAHRR